MTKQITEFKGNKAWIKDAGVGFKALPEGEEPLDAYLRMENYLFTLARSDHTFARRLLLTGTADIVYEVEIGDTSSFWGYEYVYDSGANAYGVALMGVRTHIAKAYAFDDSLTDPQLVSDLSHTLQQEADGIDTYASRGDHDPTMLWTTGGRTFLVAVALGDVTNHPGYVPGRQRMDLLKAMGAINDNPYVVDLDKIAKSTDLLVTEPPFKEHR